MQMIGFAAFASLIASSFWTATDPFVGKWRLDVARSTIVDAMRVERLDGNRFRFSFEGAPSETIVADGTDQSGLPGTTLAVRVSDPRALSVIRKQDGRVAISAKWTLSRDGRTLHDDFTNLQPDGSTSTTHYVYHRLAGTSGFAGDWESTTPPIGLKQEIEILPYESKGLSFVTSASNKTVIFDGSERAEGDARDGLTLSGQRRGPRSMRYIEKASGKLKADRQFEVSRDGRTLRETVSLPGQRTPNRYVFERE